MAPTINAGMSITIQGDASRDTIQRVESFGRSHVENVSRAVAEAMDARNPDMMRAVAEMRRV